ncbi:MAG: sulfurtransferase [Denitrovibrio sp.]|nr:MAG: sulfurtransferase [Denitrovibrio sp.]
MKRLTTIIFVLIFTMTCFTAFAAAPTEPASITKARDAMVDAAVKQIKEIEVADVISMMKNKESFVLLDIREAAEQGFIIPGNTKKIPRGLVEWLVGKQVKLNETVVVYCKTGLRGAFTTKVLNDLGYSKAVNLKGGIVAWLEAGYPVETYIGNIKPDGYKFAK